MNILVPIKSVPDPAWPVRVRRDGRGVEETAPGWVINPCDAVALEAAVRWREQGSATEVTVVSIGPAAWREEVRTALALGADRGIRIDLEEPPEPLHVARLLAALVEREGFHLVLAGQQAADSDNRLTPQLLAALLGWGQATNGSALTVLGEWIEVVREVDRGQSRMRVRLPAVISVGLRLNTPRYASLPAIMRAKRKPLVEIAAQELAPEMAPQWRLSAVREPPRRPPGEHCPDIAALAAKICEILR